MEVREEEAISIDILSEIIQKIKLFPRGFCRNIKIGNPTTFMNAATPIINMMITTQNKLKPVESIGSLLTRTIIHKFTANPSSCIIPSTANRR